MNKLDDFTHDIDGNPISYDGNPALKRPRVKLGYKKEHIEEYLKCANDWRYFVENYHHIISLDEGVVKIKLRDYQLDMIENYINERFNIVLASRQIGKTESYVCFMLWYILFEKDKTVALLANKLKTTKGILRKLKQSYELLPKWIQQGVKTWNTTEIVLENGCSVWAGATTSSSIRSGSANIVIIDEMAHVPRGIWTEFYESTYPTISSSKDSKVIMVSTPNGMNHFYKFWNDSVEGRNAFKNYRVDWWQVPGRDEAWKEQTISNTSMVSFAQEHGNSFLGSISTLIEPEYIKDLKYIPNLQNHTFKIDNRYEKYIKIYEKPKAGHTYSLGVDSAKMTEDNAGDALGMQVLDITDFPFKQVGTFYAKNGISYLQAPKIICDLGNYYNQAHIFIENNEIGQEVANMVHFDYEYENTYFEKGSLPGYRTTKKTKRIGCTNLKLLIENNKLILNDFNTISQLSTFIRVKDSYKAESGYQDDLVMSLIAALHVLISKGLDLTSYDSAAQLSAKILDTAIQEDEESEPFSVGFFPDDEYIESEPSPFGPGSNWERIR